MPVPDAPARLARALGAVWLCYDLADLAVGGTARALGPAGPQAWLVAAQLVCGGCGAMLALGRPRQPWALAAAGSRGLEAALFGLNDFYYVATMCLALAVAAPDAAAAGREQARLLRQTAWIYAATALLKLHPAWLSGGILFVRQGYQAARGPWPMPPAYAGCLASLPCQAVLAHAAVAAELALAGLLCACAARPLWRRTLWRPATVLALGVHGFAAVATNVWFFGASMALQVAVLSYAPPGPASSRVAGAAT